MPTSNWMPTFNVAVYDITLKFFQHSEVSSESRKSSPWNLYMGAFIWTFWYTPFSLEYITSAGSSLKFHKCSNQLHKVVNFWTKHMQYGKALCLTMQYSCADRLLRECLFDERAEVGEKQKSNRFFGTKRSLNCTLKVPFFVAHSLQRTIQMVRQKIKNVLSNKSRPHNEPHKATWNAYSMLKSFVTVLTGFRASAVICMFQL